MRIISRDFASLYPHNFIQHNLFSHSCSCCSDDEKYSGKGIFKLKGKYCSKKFGVMEGALLRIYLRRLDLKKKKDSRQYPLKIVINCYSDDVEILTKNGIKKMIDCEIGELVYSINPLTEQIELKPIINKILTPYKGIMYHLKSRRYDMIITPNHKMLLRKRDEQKLKFIEMQNLNTYERIFPKYGKMKFGKQHNPDLLLFYGYYLSEGSARHIFRNGHSNGYEVQISQYKKINPEIYNNIQKNLNSLKIKYSIRKDEKGFNIYSKKITEKIITTLGRTVDKHIPDSILDSYDEESLLALFRGMYEGDGTKQINVYTTKNIKLRDSFIKLITMLGYKWIYGFDSNVWRIRFQTHGKNVTLKTRNIKKINYDGNITCLTVDDNHTVLVGRNGKFEFSGQTMYGLAGKSAFRHTYSLTTAADCTYIGRECLKYTIKIYQENGYEVLYGDSVGKDSKIVIRINNKQKQFTMDSFFNFLIDIGYPILEQNNKEYIYLNDEFFTPTIDDNFIVDDKPVKYIVRHKIGNKKKCFEIKQNSLNSLIVTEDHSIINYDFKGKKFIEVKPEFVKKLIVKSNYIKKPIRTNINHDAEMLGFWIGDGSISGKCNLGFACGLDSDEIIEKCLRKTTFLNKSTLIPTKKGDVKPSSIKLRQFMKQYKFEGTSRTKRIPEYVFNQDSDFILSFLRGLFSADGTYIKSKNFIRYTSVNNNLINDIVKLLDMVGLGYSTIKETNDNRYVGVIPKKGKSYSYHIRISAMDNMYFKNNIGFIQKRKESIIEQKTTVRYSFSQVKFVKEIEYNDYVYDIEVEDTHKFYANNILVHNTDSVFIIDPFDDVDKENKIAEQITNQLREWSLFPQDTFNLSFENEIKAIFFFKSGDQFIKKNYIYITDDNEMIIKGLPIIKSNVSKVSSYIFNNFLKKQIYETLNVKFHRGYIYTLIHDELEKEIMLGAQDFKVREYEHYEEQAKKSHSEGRASSPLPTGLQAQISKRYGSGTHTLIPNNKYGIGKDKKYCTIAEFKEKELKVRNINIEKAISELTPFIKDQQEKLF